MKDMNMINDSYEMHELVLSAIDLLSMSKTFSEEELRKIFDRIESTSDGAYRHYAESVYRFLTIQE